MTRTIMTALAVLGMNCGIHAASAEIYPEVKSYIEESIGQFDRIPEARKSDLKDFAATVKARIDEGLPIDITFICTHNSRRSHMSQIWAQTAAAYYGLGKVTAYSGGTEATAFNPRAVAAVRRAGFKVEKTTEAANPIYHVRYSDDARPMTNFSKVYDDAPNPKKDFYAVMTCGDADRNCPAVTGCLDRVPITYEDPKAFDGTEHEAEAYNERCRQISRELLYLFSQISEV